MGCVNKPEARTTRRGMRTARRGKDQTRTTLLAQLLSVSAWALPHHDGPVTVCDLVLAPICDCAHWPLYEPE